MTQIAAQVITSRHRDAKTGIDWNARRDAYLTAVDDLYRRIEAMLAQPVRQGDATLRREPRQITENYLGTYDVHDLILEVGNEHVRFVPRGRNIVGAAGRVDVLGDGGDATLIVQAVEDGGRWGIVATRQPKLRVVEFSDGTFAELLKDVMAP